MAFCQWRTKETDRDDYSISGHFVLDVVSVGGMVVVSLKGFCPPKPGAAGCAIHPPIAQGSPAALFGGGFDKVMNIFQPMPRTEKERREQLAAGYRSVQAEYQRAAQALIKDDPDLAAFADARAEQNAVWAHEEECILAALH